MALGLATSLRPRAMAVTTLLLLLLFATARAMAMAEDEANFVSSADTMPSDEDQEMASMSHARGGLNDASRELPSLRTAGADKAMSAGREASLGAIAAVEPHPEFQEFIRKHKKSGHNYCPDLPPGTPCVEMLRRCARFSTTPPTPFIFYDSGETRPPRRTFRSPPSPPPRDAGSSRSWRTRRSSTHTTPGPTRRSRWARPPTPISRRRSSGARCSSTRRRRASRRSARRRRHALRRALARRARVKPFPASTPPPG